MATEALHAGRSARQTEAVALSQAHPDVSSRVLLGGVLLDRVDRADAVGRIRGFLGAGELHQVVTVNLDFVAIARRDAYFQDTLNAAELAVADGMPLVWLSRLGKYPLPQHVTGIEMAEEC
jgi:N-acetylglucosaminyldiphosphoundecaprenol N-acetyl-beta-D-mannosaminyltransferase